MNVVTNFTLSFNGLLGEHVELISGDSGHIIVRIIFFYADADVSIEKNNPHRARSVKCWGDYISDNGGGHLIYSIPIYDDDISIKRAIIASHPVRLIFLLR